MGSHKYVVLAMLISGAITASIIDWARTPKQVYVQTEDFNQDGVPDLVIKQQQGHKIPMYGLKEEGGPIRYISGSEMIRRNPDSIVNYPAIESRLNKSDNSQ